MGLLRKVTPVGGERMGLRKVTPVGAREPPTLRLRRLGSDASYRIGARRTPLVDLRRSVPLGSLRRSVPLAGVRRDKLKPMRARLGRQKPRPDPESTLEARPLQAGGVSGPLAKTQSDVGDWHLVLDDRHRRSFVSYFKSAFARPLLRKWWDLLHDKIRWERPMVGEKRLPRSAAWLTLGDCTCTYKYGRTAWQAQQMEPWFLEITDAVCHACGLKERPNSCNANLYEDGTQSVGWHTDDEILFDATRQDALIVSLSLGAGRSFELRPDDDLEKVTALQLDDGDVCTMEGLLQKHYKHRVGAERGVSSPRINLTWRWIVAHDSSCPLHSKESSKIALAGEAVHRKDKLDEITVHRSVQNSASRDDDTPRRSAPLVELSAEEKAKRARRAQRFGLPVDLELPESKEAPTARARPSVPQFVAEGATQVGSGEDEKKRKSRAERFGLTSEPPKVARVGARAVSLTPQSGVTTVVGEQHRKLHSESNSAADRSSTLALTGSDLEKARKRVERFASTKPLIVDENGRGEINESEKLKKREERFSDAKSTGEGQPKLRSERVAATPTNVNGRGELRPLVGVESDKLQLRMERFSDTKAASSTSMSVPVVSKSAREEEEEKRKQRAQRFKDTPSAPAEKIAKVTPVAQPPSTMSEEEKRKQRAEKFATESIAKVTPAAQSLSTMSEEEKRKQRAKKFGLS